MSFEVTNPFPVFTDLSGEPLENGNIYIGTVLLSPETSPIVVYWDEALTIPATQPIRTLGGYPDRAGTPSRLYVAENTFSITVRNKNNALVFSELGSAVIETSVLFYDTKSDMSAILSSSVTEGQVVYMSGRSTIGDGGQGEFVATLISIATEVTADTEEGIYVPFDSDPTGASGGFIREFSGALNARWFGANPSNSAAANNTAIQAALDWAKTVVANIGVGIDKVTAAVFIPAGTYAVTGLTVGEGVWLYGESQNTTFLKTAGAVTAIQMGASGATFFSGIWVTDLAIQGDDTTAGSIGIQFDNTIRNCGIARVFILECDTLIMGNDWAMQILSCHLRGALTDGIFWDNGSHSIIANCRIDVAGRNCIRIDGQTAETINLNIKDCNLQSAQESGFYAIDAGSVYLSNVDFESNNKLNLTTHSDVKFIAGTAARTNNVHTIQGGFYSVGSSPTGNHVCIDVDEADTLNVVGIHARGSGFAKGVVAGANVNSLNLYGNFFQSVVIPVEATATTRVFDTDREGVFLRNKVAFDLVGAYGRQDSLLLQNMAAVAGVDELGASIMFTDNGGVLRRTGFVAIQTGSDADQMGMGVVTHPSASAVDSTIPFIFRHDAAIVFNTHATLKPIITSGSGTPEATVTANVGSLYVNLTGGAGTSLYVKETGTGNTGWVGK